MKTLRPEILAFTRACERLLSREITLTEEEHQLIDYYLANTSQTLLPFAYARATHRVSTLRQGRKALGSPKLHVFD